MVAVAGSVVVITVVFVIAVIVIDLIEVTGPTGFGQPVVVAVELIVVGLAVVVVAVANTEDGG